MLRKANSPVEGTIKLMFSTIALIIIAIAVCTLAIMYYRERKDLVQQLRDIDYSLSEMRASLNKLELINNKMLAIESKVQNSIDKTVSIKNNIENNVTTRLAGIKASQDSCIAKLDSKTNKLQNTIDNLVKENAIKYQDLVNDITKQIVNSECRTGTKLNTINERIDAIGGCVVVALEEKRTHCKAKNSSKDSKTKNTTKSNKQENDKLKTAE